LFKKNLKNQGANTLDEFLYKKLEKKFAVVSDILDGARNTIEVN
jgi:hypothetical protein